MASSFQLIYILNDLSAKFYYCQILINQVTLLIYQYKVYSYINLIYVFKFVKIIAGNSALGLQG